MNYHVEHHMFPMVPFHRLPELHEEIKHDLAPVYPSIWAAYKELVPAVLRQLRDETHFVRRELPPTAQPFNIPTPVNDGRAAAAGHRHRLSREQNAMSQWIAACDVEDVDLEDVIPFDHAGNAYAVYRSPDDAYFATDGHCTHERSCSATGWSWTG